MPCCTFDKRPDAFHPVGIFFVCGFLLVAMLPLAGVLSLLSLLLPPLRSLARRAWSLLSVTRGVVTTDFLHPRYRCALSAKLMDRSPYLAGLVYRHLNVAALAALWSLVGTTAVGTAAALWI